ncbi:MAG: glycosyltransferase [Candidatus Marinimicrobia bacterium]|nr:glycosyltransferase [Candidatus Neomarinimicrobiota bacterium]
MIVNYFLIISASLYFITLMTIYFLAGKRTKLSTEKKFNGFISILVCSKNEESVIKNLLESLTRLIYPEDKYEVVLIDDESEDNTFDIMREYVKKNANWFCYRNQITDKSIKGKKRPITFGIEKCKGDIILTTDADCIVPRGWIHSMVKFFDNENVGMILGHSPVRKGRGIINKIQRFDAVCESIVALATSNINKPFHSNGRNLAYRKKVFYEVGGYEDNKHIASGDDFFLSKSILEKTNYKFVYNTSPDSFVITEPEKFGIKYFFQQLRRNSKAFYLPMDYFLFAANAFLFHLFLLLSFLTGYVVIPVVCLAVKFLIEFLPVYRGVKIFQATDLIKYYPILWVLYPIVMITSAFIGSIFRLSSWR